MNKKNINTTQVVINQNNLPNFIDGHFRVEASQDIDLNASTIVFKPKSLGRKLEMIDWENFALWLLNNKLSYQDIKVFAVMCTFIKPKTTECLFTRLQLCSKLQGMSKEQVSRSIKKLKQADMISKDNLGVYHINPKITFNGSISSYRAKGLI